MGMIKLLPILLAVAYGLVMWRFSTWRLHSELDAKSRLLDDPELAALTGKMAKALDLKRLRVFVHEVDVINGLAAPDGRIFITRGFLAAKAAGKVTAEELASVIAHELGHVALGHSRRRMIDFSGQNALRTALAMVLGRFIPGLGPAIANGAMTVMMARLSRSDEFEADAYASALLTKSGIGTAPQKSLFAKLDHLTGARGASTPAWFLSHPPAPKRIAAIEGNERKWHGAPLS